MTSPATTHPTPPRAATEAEPTPDVDVDVDAFALLAWAGWQVRIPHAWQPLKLEGTPSKGQVIVGDDTCAIFILKWERQKRDLAAEGRAWVAQRLRKLGLHGDEHPPASAHFTACGWAHEVQTEEEKKTTFWFGYARNARLLLGVTVNGVLPAAQRRIVVEYVLPTLRTTAEHAPCTWAMYDVSFESPPGYTLAERHLFSGDVALRFDGPRRASLLLRQVYPGDLALRRRIPERWMAMPPFREHRKIRRRSIELEAWRHGTRGELAGTRRRAWKRLGMPLGWCAPRRAEALAVHDTALNRLLLVEQLDPRATDPALCATAVARMNAAVTGQAW